MNTLSPFQTDRSFASSQDKADTLHFLKERFYLPAAPKGGISTYMCSNSLGCQARTASTYVEQVMEQWKEIAVKGHFQGEHPWTTYHEELDILMSKVVGGKAEEVTIMNTLTVNLHLMMVSFYRPTPSRYKILVEGNAFPSDLYACESQIRFHGFEPEESLLKIFPREGEELLREEDIFQLITEKGEEIALVMLGGLNYYTGQVLDMEAITIAGHEKGCLVGFDLAHAAGNVPLSLHEWGVDFASWCTYKYMCSGPGGPSAVFIHERWLGEKNIPRFEGWWGHDKKERFLMEPHFKAIPTAEAWQLSNAPILPLATLRASLEIFDEMGMEALRHKSIALTDYLAYLLQPLVGDGSIRILTPMDAERRGAQLSLFFSSRGKEQFQKLMEAGVICDWREPNVIRLAPSPLYNTFEDIWIAANALTG
ncbi:MAG: kynureninase [Bacteroidota bacterium]